VVSLFATNLLRLESLVTLRDDGSYFIIVDVDTAVFAASVASYLFCYCYCCGRAAGRASFESNGSKIRVGTKFIHTHPLQF
jgi:hypothetical protein